MRKWFQVAALVVASMQGALAQDEAEGKIRAALKDLAPNIKVNEVRKAAVEGFYEVIVQDSQIVYVSADGRYLLQGSLFEIPTKSDLTEARRADLRLNLLARAPSNQRIIFAPKGEPKYKVAVFTDIDCGFCRELHKHVQEYNERGIQIEYLFFPRAGVGSDSHRKAVATWCAKDKQATLTKAKNGEDPGNASCVNPVADQYQLGQQMGITGTPTLVFSDGSIAPGYVTPDQLEQRLAAMQAAAPAGKE
jgi:thiol:disulfide interchange protein DsbC